MLSVCGISSLQTHGACVLLSVIAFRYITHIQENYSATLANFQ